MTVNIDLENQEVSADRTIRESGHSLVVSIPPDLLDAAGLEEGEDVTIVAQHGEQELTINPSETAEADVPDEE